jgi:hypothetical protein
MNKVFICSPFAGDIEGNIKVARSLCHLAIDNSYVPFVPHLRYPQFLDDKNPVERELGISTGLNFMDCCEEVWAYIANGITEGMKFELKCAKTLNKKIHHLESFDLLKE